MKKIFCSFLAVASVAMMTSCSEEEIPQENSAEITITQPVTDDLVHHEDTLRIRGTIVSVLDLHGYNVAITRTTDDSEVFTFTDHYHGTSKDLEVDWICDIAEDAELQLTVTATLNHDGATTSKSMLFHCEP